MRRRCPHFAESFAPMKVHNERTIAKYDCRLDVAFGEMRGEKLDIWPGRAGSPILLFIHGGYWRAFDKEISATWQNDSLKPAHVWFSTTTICALG